MHVNNGVVQLDMSILSNTHDIVTAENDKNGLVTSGKESYDTYSTKRSSKKNTRYYQIDIVSSMDLISKGVKLNTNNDIIILNTTCDITVPAMPALQQKKLSDTSYMNQMWIGHKLKLMLTTLYTYFDYLCMYS